MSKLVVISDDLMWGSSALAIAQAAGLEVALQSPQHPLPEDLSAIVLDLASTGFDGLAVAEELTANAQLAAKPKIGVYSHVDVETQRRAKDLGLELVVPRSRFAREGGDLLKKLLEL